MNPKDEKKQTIDTYNRTAKIHAQKFNELGARVEDIEKTFSYVTKTNPKTIELGCGNGRDAQEIIKRTNDYLGIDLSEELLNIARDNVPSARFELADFETFEFPDGTDIIFAFASLLHTDKENLRSLFSRVERALSSGGAFFISSKYGNYHKETIDKEGHGPKTYYFYTPENIRELLPTGLSIIYQGVQDFKSQKWFTVILQKD